jgi:hypothetical protein
MKTLKEINDYRIAHGLEPFAVMPGTMRPGKTAMQDRHQKASNAAKRAQANRDMKMSRSSKARSK